MKSELLPRMAIRSMSVLPPHPPTILASPTSQERYISYTAPRLQEFMEYDGVPDSVSKIINEHAAQHQTSVSLQALMRTGRGEFLHKSFDEDLIENPQHSATELVLIQVSLCSD